MLKKITIIIILCCSSFFALAEPSAAFDKNSRKILFVSGNHSNKAKVTLLKEMAEGKGVSIEHKPESTFADVAEAATVFAGFDLVVLDAVSERESRQTYEKYGPVISKHKGKIFAIGDVNAEPLRQGISLSQAQQLHEYWDNGGRANLTRLLDYLAHRVLDSTKTQVEPPIRYPSQGIYHPGYEGLIFAGLDDYLKWRQTMVAKNTPRPVIGILLQRALIESAQTEVIDRTIEEVEAKGALAVPFFFELSPNAADYSALIRKEGTTFVDLIINFRAIHWAARRKTEFEQLGVPVLQALTYYGGNQAAWEADQQGIPSGMTPFVLVLPESSGVVDPMLVAAVNENSQRAETIGYQLEHLVAKAFNIARLKFLPNREKKITVFVWGDKDMGASFLNVPDSLHTIAHRLHKEGYRIEPHEHDYYSDRAQRILDPFYRDYELQALLDDDLAELMPVDQYLQWFRTLPEAVTRPIEEYWGHPRDNFMAVNRGGEYYFVIPRIRNGNMLVMRQPPRADDKQEDERIYHQGTVPINHFYLAAYYHAREFWRSDAIVHLGTHGSQEYLGGKERGLSMFDDGNLAVWDTPVVYPFIVDDVGEAMQTKRRGRATVISHMTPPFAAAGLQGDLADIHELMHEYKALDEGGVKQKTAQRIVQECLEKHICADMGWEKTRIDADFEGFLQALHSHMEELAATHQPLGLHSFGELPRDELVTSTLVQMLGSEFIELAADFEARAYKGVHHHQHHSETQARRNSGPDHDHGFHETSEELQNLAGFKTVRDYVIGAAGFPPAAEHRHAGDHKDHTHTSAPPVPLSELDKPLRGYIERGVELYGNMLNIQELDNLVAFLSGRYIPVKTGGDPIRHPDSLPTGLNLYGFDPARVPTKAAYEQGGELVEKMIGDYYRKHQRYPDKMAFSLWSIETMRHYGVLESQALRAMGVKPQWSEDGRVIGMEIIPAAELKRPRVDVVLSVTGLYRDAFPNVMQRLAGAVEQVAALKEEGNSLWENSQRIQAQLIAEGVEAKEAEYLSTVRVFSNQSGAYGSGVDAAAWASDTWETDRKISDLYLSKMGYFYGADDSRWGQKVESVNLYGKQLSGTDIALFARSSNIYGMLSTDDPFEYFGALSLAVRNLDGKSPEMMVSNLRDANNPRAESAATFLAKELRTRMFHKRWIEEMQTEGYAGAVGMSARLDNFWGWQVVDPGLVRDDQWQEFFEVYVNDKLALKLDEWFEQVNPAALGRMMERMLEASRKDYWQTDSTTLRTLVERYTELVNQYDLFVDNEKLVKFVNTQAAGFGLNAALPEASELPSGAAANTRKETVQGQKLEQVQPEATTTEWNEQLLWSLLVGVLIFGGGFLWQAVRDREGRAWSAHYPQMEGRKRKV